MGSEKSSPSKTYTRLRSLELCRATTWLPTRPASSKVTSISCSQSRINLGSVVLVFRQTLPLCTEELWCLQLQASYPVLKKAANNTQWSRSTTCIQFQIVKYRGWIETYGPYHTLSTSISGSCPIDIFSVKHFSPWSRHGPTWRSQSPYSPAMVNNL